MDLLTSVTRSLPPETRGIKLSLEREGNDTGAILLVSLIPDKPRRKGLGQHMDTHKRIVVGTNRIEGGFEVLAGISRDAELSEVRFGKFDEKLKTALDARPDEYLLVEIRCAERR